MGNTPSVRKVGFEDVCQIYNKKEQYCIINTLNESLQDCLIKNTIKASEEEKVINTLLNKARNVTIIIYGENSIDESIYKKYEQLLALGFCNIYIYVGGMFEWLLLQDIYGTEQFPTTKQEVDILKYRSPRKLELQYITES